MSLKIMHRIIVVSCFFVTSTTIQASDCIDSNTRLNVCVMGDDMVLHMRPELPKQLTQTMFIESISSFNKTVTLRALLQYDKKHLIDVYQKKGIPYSYGKEVMNNAAHGMCHVPEMKEYIDAGGTVIYNYVFNNYELFTQVRVTVKSCRNKG